jgi:zinc and cadmium transporter
VQRPVLVFIFGFLVAESLAGLTGGLLSDRWLSRRQAGLVSLAAGTLLAAVFLDILPGALSTLGGPEALGWTFGAFLVFAALEWVMGHHHHGHASNTDEKTHAHEHRALPAALLFADALHNTADGAAVTAAFCVSTRAGIAASLAVIAHEVPQELGDYALLRTAGYTKGRALWALAAVQLTAFVGAAFILLAAEHLHAVVGPVLAIAAGMFLYIGATDLLPEIQTGHGKRERAERLGGFVLGVLLILVVSLTLH